MPGPSDRSAARLVAAVFREIADLLEILDVEVYKVPSYRRAAQALEGLGRDLAEVRREGRLLDIPGIGPNLARKVEEILDTGTSALRDRLRAKIPEGLLELLAVPGVGPRTAGLLHRRLGVAGVEDLERALRTGALRSLPGWGERKVQTLEESLRRWQEASHRHLLGTAWWLAREVVAAARRLPGVRAAEVAGSVRRACETVGDVDVVVAADSPGVLSALARLPGAEAPGAVVGRRVTVRLGGVAVEFAVVPPPAFACALFVNTGSRSHVERLRERARSRGWELEEDGLRRIGQPEETCQPGSEEEVYRLLGLPWIPPELREDGGEVEAAEEGRLPDLLAPTDVRGDLHVHTEWSDGSASIEEMARAARDLGYEYVAVSDHSRSLRVARGLDPERLRQQAAVIAQLNEELAPFRILHGAEVDIMKDGSLDYPEDVLAGLDVVVASVHSAFRLDREAMTARVLAAVRHPLVHVVGHPTARLLGRRPPVELDLERVLEACAEHGTALELNASPDRLDLAVHHARAAAEAGIPLVINTDAHHVASLADMEPGVHYARRAWLTRRHVLNALPLADLLAALGRKGSRAARA